MLHLASEAGKKIDQHFPDCNWIQDEKKDCSLVLTYLILKLLYPSFNFPCTDDDAVSIAIVGF